MKNLMWNIIGYDKIKGTIFEDIDDKNVLIINL